MNGKGSKGDKRKGEGRRYNRKDVKEREEREGVKGGMERGV